MTLKGPPTPPPTSAVELQDQARSIAHEKSTSAQLVSETETRSEIYQSALPAIVETIQSNDYAGLVKVTEQVDFTVIYESVFIFFFGLTSSKDNRRPPAIKIDYRCTSHTRPFGAG